MAKIGDRRKDNGGWRPGAGRKPLYKKPELVYFPDNRVDVAKYCQEMGFDPVVSMVELTQDEKISPSIKLQAYREIARYIHPTRAAVQVEHSGKIEGDLSEKSLEELRGMLDEYRSGGA